MPDRPTSATAKVDTHVPVRRTVAVPRLGGFASTQISSSLCKNVNDSEGNNMRDQFSNAQQIRKPAVVSKGGIVAAQSRKAAEVGARVLAAGGDCVDAVIATTFALGVLEPWMSGVGGGGGGGGGVCFFPRAGGP